MRPFAFAQKIGRTDPIRELIPDGVGPVILQACQADQSALGHPLIDLRGSGLFLVALAMTLDEEFEQADLNHDKKLVPEELRDSLISLVPKLVDRLRKVGNIAAREVQTPVAFIPRLELGTNAFPLAKRE